MAIPLDGMMGYVRTRPKPGPKKPGPDGAPVAEMELWIDPNVVLVTGPAGPVVGKPADCAGILYSVPGGRLEVRYPE